MNDIYIYIMDYDEARRCPENSHVACQRLANQSNHNSISRACDSVTWQAVLTVLVALEACSGLGMVRFVMTKDKLRGWQKRSKPW